MSEILSELLYFCVSLSVRTNTFVQCGNTIITQVINSSSSGSSSNKT